MFEQMKLVMDLAINNNEEFEDKEESLLGYCLQRHGPSKGPKSV